MAAFPGCLAGITATEADYAVANRPCALLVLEVKGAYGEFGTVLRAVMESERYFSGEIIVVHADGARQSAKVTADEITEGDRARYRVSLEQDTESRVAEAEEDFFEALKKLRLDLEKSGTLLCCFGASENVYPSGMQRSMGPAILAYRMRMGSAALRQDIVNIFETDQTVVPSTVEQQEHFRKRWTMSLSGKA